MTVALQCVQFCDVVRGDFLTQDEVCAGEVFVRVADEERAALGDEVDHVPTFESHFVKGGDVHRVAFGRIAEDFTERQEQAFVEEIKGAF